MESSGRRSGQALLIIVLVMAIAVTIGLSVIGRTTTDVRMTSQIEDSARAFSAAEAGVEIALKTNTAQSNVNYMTGLTYSTSISSVLPGTGAFPVPPPSGAVPLGTVGTIILANPLPDGSGTLPATSYGGPSLTVCWKGSGAGTPALEAILYYLDGTAYKTTRYAFDDAGAGHNANNFTSAGAAGSGCGLSGVYVQSIPMVAGTTPLMLRLRPYYASAQIYAMAPTGYSLTISQGEQVDSTGTAEGGVTRKITVMRQYRVPPSLFDFVVYSQAQFAK